MAQETHKERHVQFACVPKRVYEVNRMLVEKQVDGRWNFINDSCFGGMLKITSKPVSVAPMMRLIQAWDAVARCFRFNDGRTLEISPERVAAVYGLTHGHGTDIITKEKLTANDDFCEEMRGRFKLCKEGETNVDWARLSSLVTSANWKDEMDVVDYWRLYCLFCIGAVLTPLPNRRLKLGYLTLLRTPEVASSFNWAILVQESIFAKISPTGAARNEAKSIGSRLGGNFHCLTHVFYDFIECKSGGYYTCSLVRCLTMTDVLKYVGPPSGGITRDTPGNDSKSGKEVRGITRDTPGNDSKSGKEVKAEVAAATTGTMDCDEGANSEDNRNMDRSARKLYLRRQLDRVRAEIVLLRKREHEIVKELNGLDFEPCKLNIKEEFAAAPADSSSGKRLRVR